MERGNRRRIVRALEVIDATSVSLAEWQGADAAAVLHGRHCVRRHHRWARGDWQLLPWLLKRNVTGGRRGGWLPLIGAWKIIDNLRRTLSAPLTLAPLVAALTIPSVPAGPWTGFVLTSLIIPPALPS